MQIDARLGWFLALCSLTIAAGCGEAPNAASSSNVAAVEAGVMRPPQVGDAAPDFTLKKLNDEEISLDELLKAGPVVLIVLRGYPGYQCPLCTRQVGELLSKAEAFSGAGASVVLIYPGDSDQLDQFAREFVGDRHLPAHFHFVLDPGYQFTNRYGLRWDALNETVYPASFVIDSQGNVRYAKVSKSHGDRASVDELMNALTADAK